MLLAATVPRNRHLQLITRHSRAARNTAALRATVGRAVRRAAKLRAAKLRAAQPRRRMRARVCARALSSRRPSKAGGRPSKLKPFFS